MDKTKRKAIIAGNWKMNKTPSEAKALLEAVVPAVKDADCEVIACVPFVDLSVALETTKGSNVKIGAENCHWAESGAFTGEISADMLAEMGVEYVVLGHSERRQYHQETHATLVNKLIHALSQNLGVIYCIGETQAQYDNQQTLEVLDSQLSVLPDMLAQVALSQPDIAAHLAERLIIAYEPVWAIGTGKIPTVSEVSATHQHIKQTVAEFAESLSAVKVLYGGSVNADNADSFAASPMIDGALVGGASLKVASFLSIAEAFSRAKAAVKNNP